MTRETSSRQFDPKWSSSGRVFRKTKMNIIFFCSVYVKDVSCSYQGLSDVKRHIQFQGHQQAVKHAVGETQGSVSTLMVPEPLQDKITSAEIKMTVFLAKHNLPIAKKVLMWKNKIIRHFQ